MVAGVDWDDLEPLAAVVMVFFLLILLYHFSLSEVPIIGLIRVYMLKKRIYLEEGHYEDLHITIIPIIKPFFHIHAKRQGVPQPATTNDTPWWLDYPST